MTSPRRLLASEPKLPAELTRALRAAPGTPGDLELQQLAARLSAVLAVAPLALAPVAAPTTAASTTTAASVATTKPALTLGAWVLGGVALGVGLSSVAAFTATSLDGSTPLSSASAPPRRASPRQPLVTPTASVEPQPVVVPSPSALTVHKAPAAPSVEPEPLGAQAAVLEPRENEMALLRRAQAAVATNPRQALALSDLHASAFPQGVLTQEREVIAINALVRLGRAREASVRAHTFAIQYPRSAHTPRLRALIEENGLTW